MNIFHKVTRESLKQNRTRTAVTIIGIILSAAMICAVTAFVSSFQRFLYNNAVYEEGNWHGKVIMADDAVCKEIEDDKETNTVSIMQMEGYAYVENCINMDKPYLYIGAVNQTFMDNMPVHLTGGRLPKNSGEILIPDHLASNGGVVWELGQTITLQVGSRVSEGYVLNQSNPYSGNADEEGEGEGEGEEPEEELVDTKEKTFTIVGFYARPGFEDYSAPGYTALTAMDEQALGTAYDIYFCMKQPGQVYAYLDKVEENTGYSTGYNREVLMFSGVSRHDSFNRTIMALAGIVIGLIMFGSVSLIYNAFAISVSERTKQFGLMSSVGATKKQLRASVLYEAFIVSIIGIPIGCTCGILGIGVTLRLLEKKLIMLTGYAVELKLYVSLLSVAAAVIIALITVLISAWIPSRRAMRVTAIEAIRQNADVKVSAKSVKTSALIRKIFGFEGMLAQKYYKRNKKKYRTTILSLFMSIVLFISASSLCSYLTDTVSKGFDTYDFDIMMQVRTDEAFQHKDTHSLYQSLKNVDGAGESAMYHAMMVNSRFPISDCSEEYLQYQEEIWQKTGGESYKTEGDENGTFIVYFVSDDAYQAVIKDNKLDASKYETENPPAICYDNQTTFDSSTGKYYHYSTLKHSVSSVQLEGVKPLDGYQYFEKVWLEREGHLANRYVKFGENDEIIDEVFVKEEESAEYYEVSIGDYIEKRPMFIASDFCLIYPLSMTDSELAARSENPENSGMLEFVFQTEQHEKVYDAMKEILDKTGLPYSDIDYAAEAETNRSLVTVISVFAYGFITLISLIAMANVFNTISTNIGLRRREFAMLKSVGMTRRGFNRMMNFECVLYGIRSLLYGIPMSVFVTYLIYKAFDFSFVAGFYVPVYALFIAIFSVFAVVFITMLYSMSKIKKENPIDALKSETT